MTPAKLPVSVLVVIYTPARQVLLIRRADQGFFEQVEGPLKVALLAQDLRIQFRVTRTGLRARRLHDCRNVSNPGRHQRTRR